MLSWKMPCTALQTSGSAATEVGVAAGVEYDDDSSPAPAPAAADPDFCAAVHGMFHENICYVPLMQIDDDYSDS